VPAGTDRRDYPQREEFAVVLGHGRGALMVCGVSGRDA
jgi:hypothetical protein